MGDWGLEDKYLRRNIPGRYASHWERDGDDHDRGDEPDVDAESEDDDAEPQCAPHPDPEPLRYGEAPGIHGMTGAKAQLAQYK